MYFATLKALFVVVDGRSRSLFMRNLLFLTSFCSFEDIFFPLKKTSGFGSLLGIVFSWCPPPTILFCLLLVFFKSFLLHWILVSSQYLRQLDTVRCLLFLGNSSSIGSPLNRFPSRKNLFKKKMFVDHELNVYHICYDFIESVAHLIVTYDLVSSVWYIIFNWLKFQIVLLRDPSIFLESFFSLGGWAKSMDCFSMICHVVVWTIREP